MTADLDRRVVSLTGQAKFQRSPLSLTSLSGANMKGFAVLHLLELMEAEGGAATVQAWRASLPEGLHALAERNRLTSISWVPIELYYSAVAALAVQRGISGPRGALGVGFDAASKDVGAFFRVVMKFASPTMSMQLSGRFWRSYFDKSSLTIVSSTAVSCSLEVRGWPLRDEQSMHEVCGSLMAWMTASRAAEVRVSRFELTAADAFAMDAAWK